jgi:hypothetical protein
MTPTRGLLFRERTPRRFPVFSLFPPSLPPSTFQGLCFMRQNSPLFNPIPPSRPLYPSNWRELVSFWEFLSRQISKKNPIKNKNRQILSQRFPLQQISISTHKIFPNIFPLKKKDASFSLTQTEI